ncbi:MAG: 50S ribosomal protein L30 [bacterium]
MSKVKITLVKSPIGAKKEHKGTVRALGLKKLNDSTVREMTPVLQGMVRKVSHLVKVEEAVE